jgi:hypothetical protein
MVLLQDLSVGLVGHLIDILYTAIRITAITLTGWLAVGNSSKSLWYAALFGAVVFFIDQVLLRGAGFLFLAQVDVAGRDVSSVAAIGGAVISFVLFVPISLALGAIGGWLRKRRYKR